MPALTVALLLVVAWLYAGCGTAGRERDARNVVQSFQTALDHRDGTAACAELSADTSKRLEQDEGDPCQKAILDLGLPSGDVPVDTHVATTSASVSLRGGETLFLDQGRDGWRISAAGCTRTAPDEPLDCDLES